ncbi:MAG: AIM24 family protein, partial [Thermoanaerobaculia bacterium]|nr:AIM24 family protein [Thermoanaerobaculia bacterium]
DAFLAAAKGVSIGIAFQKKIGVGLFGGEGFIMQRLTGDGLAFIHAGGTVVERRLEANETMRLDTGCLVAFESQVRYDIQTVSGIKTALFGGEGLFYAALTGPGRVWIQSLPFSRLASRVYAAAPQTGGSRKGEGSLLGGLGDLVMGD